MIGLLLAAATAFACKPAPLPACAGGDKPVTLRASALARLRTTVDAYQTLLNHSIRPGGPPRTSCFDNHFAAFYLQQIKPKTCAAQVKWVESQVLHLLSPDTAESRAAAPARNELERAAEPVREALRICLGNSVTLNEEVK